MNCFLIYHHPRDCCLPVAKRPYGMADRLSIRPPPQCWLAIAQPGKVSKQRRLFIRIPMRSDGQAVMPATDFWVVGPFEMDPLPTSASTTGVPGDLGKRCPQNRPSY